MCIYSEISFIWVFWWLPRKKSVWCSSDSGLGFSDVSYKLNCFLRHVLMPSFPSFLCKLFAGDTDVPLCQPPPAILHHPPLLAQQQFFDTKLCCRPFGISCHLELCVLLLGDNLFCPQNRPCQLQENRNIGNDIKGFTTLTECNILLNVANCGAD